MLALFDKMQAMPGFMLESELAGLDTSIYIFNRNFDELEKLITFLTEDPGSFRLQAVDRRDVLDTFFLEILRLLHNFVAAALSLIDHTRNQYQRLYEADKATFPDYQKRINSDFKNDPLSQFVKGLRQYCQHYRAPSIEIQLTVTKVDDGFSETRKVLLSKQDLASFSSWNLAAKNFLTAVDEKVDVLEIVKSYRDTVSNFYKWYRERQLEIHAEELSELSNVRNQAFQLDLDMKLRGCLNNKENYPWRGEELFSGLLSYTEQKRLQDLDPASLERYELLIQILEERYVLTPLEKEQIRELYMDPEFFESRSPAENSKDA